jgi:hypothetical protein
MREAAGECHARHVDGRHLGRKHCLELIPRLNTFDDRQHEIEPVLVDVLTASTCVGELAHNAIHLSLISVSGSLTSTRPTSSSWDV